MPGGRRIRPRPPRLSKYTRGQIIFGESIAARVTGINLLQKKADKRFHGHSSPPDQGSPSVPFPAATDSYHFPLTASGNCADSGWDIPGGSPRRFERGGPEGEGGNPIVGARPGSPLGIERRWAV